MAQTASAQDKRHWSEEAYDSLCDTLQREGVGITQVSREGRHRAFGDFNDRHGKPVTVTVTRPTSPKMQISVTFSREGTIFAEVRAESAQAWSWVDRGFQLPWAGLRSISFALIMIGRHVHQLQTTLEH